MTKKIVILGTNGNCVDMLDLIDSINTQAGRTVYECIGFLDDNPTLHGKTRCGVKVLGPLSMAADLEGCRFVNGIGSPGNFFIKEQIIGKANVGDEHFESLVHPRAVISKRARIGTGAVVFENVAVTSNVTIGRHVIILPNTVVSHDVEVGDYTCITGGVCISGGTRIGRSCYLGTNSTIIGDVEIGDCSLIGMGSVVLESVGPDHIVVGNPARYLRDIRQT